jgi:hypothetical protein
VAGRASVWSSQELRELTAEFVTCADEVWRLQNGTDGESLAFRAMADQGHYGGGGGTRQGIYVSSPSGKLLSSINDLDAEKVREALETGLALWHLLPEGERKIPAGADIESRHRWEGSRPEGGLVLVSVNRDLPRDLDPAQPAALKWNRDHLWLTRDEARSLLPSDPQPGARHAWPRPPLDRLAQFHLVDNVIGQTLPFAPEEVAGSAITTEVLSRSGSVVTVRFRGETRAETDGSWKLGENDWKPEKLWPRGMLARLEGRAEYDLDAGAFTSFELVAQAVRWGTAVNSGRRDLEPSPIGFVFTLAGEGADSEVAPAFVDIYADWIVQPPTG